MDKTIDRLVAKSKEAFLMAIEIYNKPSIKYRVEGFSLFICNAWELMLKAYMINKFGEESIYYSDNKNRTLSLSDCIKKVFTNNKDPLRLNLEKILELRNTSTHFITEEYEMVYIPLFQACVINYSEKLSEFHDVDITEIVPQNFLTLSATLKTIKESEIRAKYPDAIVDKFLSLKNSIDTISSETNDKFCINISVTHYQTKNPKLADHTYRIAKDGEVPVEIIKQLQDPNTIYRFTSKTLINTVQSMLKKNNIALMYRGNIATFTMFHFTNLINRFGIKENQDFCWTNRINKTPQYSYSQQAVDFVFTELSKDPEHILDNIAKK